MFANDWFCICILSDMSASETQTIGMSSPESRENQMKRIGRKTNQELSQTQLFGTTSEQLDRQCVCRLLSIQVVV